MLVARALAVQQANNYNLLCCKPTNHKGVLGDCGMGEQGWYGYLVNRQSSQLYHGIQGQING